MCSMTHVYLNQMQMQNSKCGGKSTFKDVRLQVNCFYLCNITLSKYKLYYFKNVIKCSLIFEKYSNMGRSRMDVDKSKWKVVTGSILKNSWKYHSLFPLLNTFILIVKDVEKWCLKILIIYVTWILVLFIAKMKC